MSPFLLAEDFNGNKARQGRPEILYDRRVPRRFFAAALGRENPDTVRKKKHRALRSKER